MRRGPDRRRAPFSTSSRGVPPPRPTLILRLEKLLPPARSTRTPYYFPPGSRSLTSRPRAGGSCVSMVLQPLERPPGTPFVRPPPAQPPPGLRADGGRSLFPRRPAGFSMVFPGVSPCFFPRLRSAKSTIESCGAERHGPLGGCGGK